jgi:hypothetical protein
MLHFRVGDPTKEMSSEYTLILSNALKPYDFQYPLRCALLALEPLMCIIVINWEAQQQCEKANLERIR